MTKQIQTVEHGGIMRVINRKDVGNIISSINMTLKDYGIRFELDDKENLKCVSDGVPDMLAQSQQEAVSAERERCYQIAISTKSVIGRSPLAEEIAVKIKSGEALQKGGEMTQPQQKPTLRAEKKRGLKAKIIRFNTFPDGQDKDCIAITDDGREVVVDPFVGCSWDYEKREYLIGEWFEDPEAWQHEEDGCWLTGEHSFKLLGIKETK